MGGGEREGESEVSASNERKTECEPTMQPKYSMGEGAHTLFSLIHMVDPSGGESGRKRKIVSGKVGLHVAYVRGW